MTRVISRRPKICMQVTYIRQFPVGMPPAAHERIWQYRPCGIQQAASGGPSVRTGREPNSQQAGPSLTSHAGRAPKSVHDWGRGWEALDSTRNCSFAMRLPGRWTERSRCLPSIWAHSGSLHDAGHCAAQLTEGAPVSTYWPWSYRHIISLLGGLDGSSLCLSINRCLSWVWLTCGHDLDL